MMEDPVGYNGKIIEISLDITECNLDTSKQPHVPRRYRFLLAGVTIPKLAELSTLITVL